MQCESFYTVDIAFSLCQYRSNILFRKISLAASKELLESQLTLENVQQNGINTYFFMATK